MARHGKNKNISRCGRDFLKLNQLLAVDGSMTVTGGSEAAIISSKPHGERYGV